VGSQGQWLEALGTFSGGIIRPEQHQHISSSLHSMKDSSSLGHIVLINKKDLAEKLANK